MAIGTLAKDRPLLSAAAAGLGAWYLLKLLRRRFAERGHGREIPWAKGWLPVVGHLLVFKRCMKGSPQLANGRVPLEIKETEGLGIFRMGFAGSQLVVVSSLEAIEEIVVNDSKRFTKDFSNHPTFMLMIEMLGDGLIFASTDSEAWTIPHGILKAPFSTKGVRMLLPLMVEQAERLVGCLKREVGYGGVCHIDHWVTKMAFETIAICALGTSFGSFDDDQDHPFIRALNGMFSGFVAFKGCPPTLLPIFFRRRLAQMRADSKVARDTCIEVIRKRRMKETRTIASKKDILDLMLEQRDQKSGKAMTEKQIVDNILTFLFAGQDSTAAAMGTLLCFLSANPRCKEKLMREIDTVVGTSPLEWEHLQQLKYLDWCIKEALRLLPPAGAVARIANGDQLLLNKWRIPANTMCLIGIMAIHYDKQLWGEDVNDFRPERWENGPPHKYAFMPFAAGPRSCTGREFTFIEQKVTFVTLLQNFDFRRPENTKAEPGYTTMKKELQTMPPFIDMDVELKAAGSPFVGLFSAFELLERKR